jgi:hypothetical protein
VPKHEKAKAKTARHKHRAAADRYSLEENAVATQEEIIEKTLNRLRNLGNQRFALSPFNEYFSDWLTSLKAVMSEFESCPIIKVDEQFEKERSQILSSVEVELQEKRQREASREGTVRSLSDNRLLLERIEEAYAAKAREIKAERNSGVKSMSSKIRGLREELDRITRMKTGIFRAVSKKTKEQRVAEATQRLKAAQGELASTVQRLNVEQESLRNEYDRRKQHMVEQVRDQEKEVESHEIDDSLETRRAACESLVRAVNALLQRKSSSPQ